MQGASRKQHHPCSSLPASPYCVQTPCTCPASPLAIAPQRHPLRGAGPQNPGCFSPAGAGIWADSCSRPSNSTSRWGRGTNQWSVEDL